MRYRSRERSQKRDRKEKKSKSKKKKDHRRRYRSSSSSSSSAEDSIKSSSFISEILKHKPQRDCEKIIAEVIDNLNNSKTKSDSEHDVSYTPPLPSSMRQCAANNTKNEEIENKPKTDENENDSTCGNKNEAMNVPNLQESVTLSDNKPKKKSILELPMPPALNPSEPNKTKQEHIPKDKVHKAESDLFNISLSEIPFPSDNTDKNETKVKEMNGTDMFKAQAGCKKEHFKEMQRHLDSSVIFTPNLLTTPPEYIQQKRPSVIRNLATVDTQSDYVGRVYDSFKILEQIGKGTYGKVYKAVDLRKNDLVAMKFIKMQSETEGFPITCLREIKILQQLHHPNIIKLRDIVFRDENGSTYLIFDYMNHDLQGLRINNEMNLCEENIYFIIRQVLEGLCYCHKKHIIHRDLKLSNILMNNRGEVKICDFGLSRTWTVDRPFTNKVISLWYRPIELLLGEEIYGPSVDIWSLGCMIYELFKRKPLFEHNNEFEMVNGIFQLCGSPEYNFWPEVKLLPKYKVFKPMPRMRILKNFLFPTLTPLAIELVDQMLTLNPDKRITAADALKSRWIIAMEKVNVKPLKLPKIDSFEMRARMLM